MTSLWEQRLTMVARRRVGPFAVNKNQFNGPWRSTQESGCNKQGQVYGLVVGSDL